MAKMLTAWLLFVACAPSKERQCKRIASDGMAIVGQVAGQVTKTLAGKDIELPLEDQDAIIDRLVAECMTWPDDFVACLADGDLESERCLAAYAAKEGLVVAGEGKPGPAARSRPTGADAALTCQVDRCVVERAGRVEDLAGQTLADGELAGLARGEWIAANDQGVAVGARRLPTLAAGSPEQARPVATDGDALVLFSDGRVRRLAEAPCDACWQETPWRLDIGIGFAPALHRVGERLLYHEIESMRLFAADGSTLFSFDHTLLEEPIVGERFVDVAVGDAMCRLDMDQCRGELRGLPAEPCGVCVKAGQREPGVKPARLDDATYFAEGGRVSKLSDGKVVWRVDVDADAVLAVPGALLVASYWTADHPARLLVLDPASGQVRLTMEVPSRMSIMPITLGRDRDTVVMHTNDTLFVWGVDAIRSAL